MDPRTFVACIALLGATFAGCVGDAPSGGAGGPTGTDDGNVTDGGPSSGGGAGVGTLTFDAPANASVRWANGSFGPTDGGFQYCIDDCNDLRSSFPVPVGDLIPRAVPVVVNATLTTQTNGSFAWMELSAPGADVYHESVRQQASLVNVEGEASRTELDARLGAFGDEPVEVVVKPGSSGASAGTDYTLRIEVEAWTERVPSGVPVAVEVDDPATLRAEPASAAVSVWDPKDRFLGSLGGNGSDEANLTGAPPGEYVLRASADLDRIVGDRSGDAPLRLLPRHIDVGERHELSPPSDEVSWDLDVPPGTYQVATFLDGADGPPTYGQYARTNVTGTLASPNGTVDRTTTGGFGSGTGWAAVTVAFVSHDGFVPGTWTATWSMENGGPMEAYHVVVGYNR